MDKILDRFAQYLTQIRYPTKKEHWNIAGVLKNKSNQCLKFDVGDMSTFSDGLLGRKGRTSSNADKMVFETEKAWVILDVSEMIQYLRKHKTKILYLEKLKTDLEWNITIAK
tara:strand:+ start:4118 stop:4453 length:336 start_codon:yes stop_codon:yes gene_type:complete